MAIFDIKLPKSIALALHIPISNPRSQQIKVLKKLLRKARFTEFGQRYRFDDILYSTHPGKKFQEMVPAYDYNKIYDAWWHKAKDGIPDVCWPGVIKYFALSSGTSDATSKYIPITKDLIRSNTITSFKQLLSLTKYDNIPRSSVGKGWLIFGRQYTITKRTNLFCRRP